MKQQPTIKDLLFKKKHTKYILFCHSYPYVMLTLKLYTLIKTKSNYKVIITTPLEPCYKYLSSLFSLDKNVTLVRLKDSSYKNSNPLNIIQKLKTKKMILEKFSNTTNTTVIFASDVTIPLDYYCIKLLNKNHSNHFIYIDYYENKDVLSYTQPKLSLTLKIKEKINQFFYGKDLYFDYRDNNKHFPWLKISNKFLSQFESIYNENPSIQKINIDEFKPLKIDHKYDILYLHSELNHRHGIMQKEFQKTIKKVLTIIKENFSESICFKQHPMLYKRIPYLEENYKQLPSYIPSEMINYTPIKLVITICSNSIIPPHIPIIYINNLISWKNDTIKKHWFDNIIKERDAIYIPNTIEELKEILKSLT